MEALRTGFMAADSSYLRAAVKAALEQGFRREITDTDEEQEEVDLVLREREASGKKLLLLARSGLRSLRQQLPGWASRSKRPSS